MAKKDEAISSSSMNQLTQKDEEPFKSKAQQKFLFQNDPKIAKKWAKMTPDIKDLPEHVKKGVKHESLRILAPITQLRESTSKASARVVLIEEGPGNPVDLHYYTKECLQKAVEDGLFEGMRAYINHPTMLEEEIQPERDITKLCGWYKNIEFKEDSRSGKGIIEADFCPEPGHEFILQKLGAAKEYSRQFPNESYIGWSICLAGDTDMDQTIQEGGLEYNPVVQLFKGGSVDIVTQAGAGGRLLTFREYAKQLTSERKITMPKADAKSTKTDEKKVDKVDEKKVEEKKEIGGDNPGMMEACEALEARGFKVDEAMRSHLEAFFKKEAKDMEEKKVEEKTEEKKEEAKSNEKKDAQESENKEGNSQKDKSDDGEEDGLSDSQKKDIEENKEGTSSQEESAQVEKESAQARESGKNHSQSHSVKGDLTALIEKGLSLNMHEAYTEGKNALEEDDMGESKVKEDDMEAGNALEEGEMDMEAASGDDAGEDEGKTKDDKLADAEDVPQAQQGKEAKDKKKEALGQEEEADIEKMDKEALKKEVQKARKAAKEAAKLVKTTEANLHKALRESRVATLMESADIPKAHRPRLMREALRDGKTTKDMEVIITQYKEAFLIGHDGFGAVATRESGTSEFSFDCIIED